MRRAWLPWTLPLFCVLSFAPALAQSSDREVIISPSGSSLTLQQAIDQARTAATATNPYTVRLLPGIFTQNSSINATGMTNVQIVGAGRRASVIQASQALITAWGTNSTGVDLFDMSGCTDCVLSNVGVDARTNDPGNITGTRSAAVRCDSCTRVTYDSVLIQGLQYGLWEAGSFQTGRISVFDSELQANNFAAGMSGANWFIYGTECRTLQEASHSTGFANYTAGIWVSAPQPIGLHIWGSHIHGESNENPLVGSVSGIAFAGITGGGKIDVYGSTIHSKSSATSQASACAAIYTASGGTPTFDLVGSDLIVETGAMTNGIVAGIAVLAVGTSSVWNLVGSQFVDRAGSSTGTSTRGAFVRAAASGNPTLNVVGGGWPASFVGRSTGGTINTAHYGVSSGGAILASGIARVLLITDSGNIEGATATSFTTGSTAVSGSGTTFLASFKVGDWIRAASHTDSTWTQIAAISSNTSITLAEGYRGATLPMTQAKKGLSNNATQFDSTYRVGITATAAPTANDRFYVTNKHGSGFTINSADGSSATPLDWELIR